MKRSNVSIFVPHIGCPHKCSFCDQNSITGIDKAPTPEDVNASLLRAVSTGCNPLSEIAFFGGSFTAIPREYMTSLLDAAFPFIKNGSFKGIRVSTRPDAIDDEILDFLKIKGVTSIELGAQSMVDNVLTFNHRGHKSNDVRIASALILAHGFELGLQMMTGLPIDTNEGALYTANELILLNPDTIRIYPAITLKNTLLETLYKKGEYIPQSLTQAVELCAKLLTLFEEKGIRVIRLGLHSSETLKNSTVAGPWHPAFRELCESKLMLDKLLFLLTEKGQYIINVSPQNISKMVGQKHQNLITLSNLGYTCIIKGDPALKDRDIIITQ